MVSFEQFLSESTFGPDSWGKHQYAPDVLKDLLTGKKLKLTIKDKGTKPITVNGNGYVTIDDFDKQAIEKIAKNPKSYTYTDFNNAFKSTIDHSVKRSEKSIWQNLEKTVYSKSTKADDTNSEEMAVCVCIDALTHGVKDPNDFDFTEYQCSDKITSLVNPKIIDLAKQRLNDPGWRNAVIKTANHIIKAFHNIGEYYCQYQTDWYKKIRTNATKALRNSSYQGLAPDKWNPADVIYTKKPNIDIPKTLIIADYNNWFNQLVENKEIVPISLKKSDSGAQHGSVSLGNIVKNWKLVVGDKHSKDILNLADVDISSADKSYTNINQALPDIKKDLKILSTSPLASVIKIGGEKGGVNSKFFEWIKQGKPIDKQALDDYNSTLKSKIVVDTFLQSVPQPLNFLASISKLGIEKVQDIIQTIYLIAGSNATFSSSYYKASADYCKKITQGSTNTVKLTSIAICVDGTSRVTLLCNVDGNNYKFVIRGKGGKPQFLINHEDLKSVNYQPIKNFTNDFK